MRTRFDGVACAVSSGRSAAVVGLSAVLMSVAAVPAAASPAPQAHGAQTYCVPDDVGLEELSGLTGIGGTYYAVGDSGTDHRVAVLTPPGADGQCSVAQWLDVPVDPYDVEDMASYGGNLWLSDTGDNLARRETVALTRMDPATGAGELHRLVYPDGAHDAEALIIEPGGRPIIVTKELSGIAGLYVPQDDTSVDQLASPGPTPLRKAGELLLERTETAGGPPFIGGSAAVTGAATSPDGSVAAVRTYTDAYLFSVTNGDVLAALTDVDSAVALALPDQPQGEAVTFDTEGGMLVASEAAGGVLPAIELLPGAVDLVHARMPAETGPATRAVGVTGAAVAAGIVIALLLAGFGIRRAFRRR